MPLVLPCSNCGQKIGIPEELKGKQIRCPKCRECFLVERRKTEQPESSANAAAPAAQSLASGQSAAVSKPAIVQCPSCSQKMRLPTEAGASKFRCPGCATIFNLVKREGVSAVATTSPRSVTPRPVAPRPAPSRLVSARSARSSRASSDGSGVTGRFQADSAFSGGDSLFSDLPPLPAQTRSASRGPASAFAGPSVRSARSQRTSLGRGAAARSQIDSSKLGPALLIAIPYLLALLFTLFLVLAALGNDGGRSSSRDITVLMVLFGLAASHFVAVIGGAVGMLMRAPQWLSITTCIAGMLPSIFVSTLCFGAMLYPFALAGCIWGLISLLGSSHSRVGYAGAGVGSQSPYQFGGAAAATNDYMRQASREVTEKAASNKAAVSTGKAILCIAGGIGCIGFAAFAAYSYYRYMNGEIELRRPGRAISGAVIAAITGIGLLTQGIGVFAKRSG